MATTRKVWAVFNANGKRYGGFHSYDHALAFKPLGGRVEEVEVDESGRAVGEQQRISDPKEKKR